MAITRYIQDNNDGTYTIREIEERARVIGNIDDAIENESQEISTKLQKIKDNKLKALTENEVDKNIKNQADELNKG